MLVDNSQSPPFPVMETSAEMFYLLKFYDKNDEFGFKDEIERIDCLQWTFFWHGSGAPYQGQVNHFTRAAKEKIPCECTSSPKIKNYTEEEELLTRADAIERYRNETLRVFGVLEIQLSGKYTGEPKDYLAGKGKGKYSVADMKVRIML